MFLVKTIKFLSHQHKIHIFQKQLSLLSTKSDASGNINITSANLKPITIDVELQKWFTINKKSDASGSIDRTEMIMSLKITSYKHSYLLFDQSRTSGCFYLHYITSFHYTIVGKNKTGLGKNSDFSSFFVNISL